MGSGQRPDSALGGFGRIIVRPAATPTTKVAALPSGSPDAVYAVFGFGADGTAAVGSAAAACRGIVGVDASDVWSAIGGPGHGVAALATARRGQGAGGFGRSAVSAVHEAGVEPSSVRRLLISAVLPPG